MAKTLLLGYHHFVLSRQLISMTPACTEVPVWHVGLINSAALLLQPYLPSGITESAFALTLVLSPFPSVAWLEVFKSQTTTEGRWMFKGNFDGDKGHLVTFPGGWAELQQLQWRQQILTALNPIQLPCGKCPNCSFPFSFPEGANWFLEVYNWDRAEFCTKGTASAFI